MVKFELTKTQMVFSEFWLFGELKTELQPQSPGGGVRPDPGGCCGPARARAIFFCGTRKLAKNNDFTWVLDET